MYIFDAVI